MVNWAALLAVVRKLLISILQLRTPWSFLRFLPRSWRWEACFGLCAIRTQRERPGQVERPATCLMVRQRDKKEWGLFFDGVRGCRKVGRRRSPSCRPPSAIKERPIVTASCA